jgi:hypothetical protein
MLLLIFLTWSACACACADIRACACLNVLQLPPLRVTPMGSKGWGVVAQQDIPPGAFVAEYLGRFIRAVQTALFAALHVQFDE